MWHWDQGHLAYFQFDAIQRIARFVLANDAKNATKDALAAATGLPFAAPDGYSAWRNYSRTLKLSLLVSEVGNSAQATEVAALLAQPGKATCDEYFHFLLRIFTEPSPALADWSPKGPFRYPLLFSLKYLLAKTATGYTKSTSVSEIIGAYGYSNFSGGENDEEFIYLIGKAAEFEKIGASASSRQARESLRVIAQISYLFAGRQGMLVALDREDAHAIFHALNPIEGPRKTGREAEIRRLAELFKDGSNDDFFDYPATIIGDVVESGFREGSKVKKTHVTIERNRNLRIAFFNANPTSICDFCELDTRKSYNWTDRVMDIHHLLPLCSGARVEKTGTTFDDLVPLCPTCHRAVHRFYDRWLERHKQADFLSREEAKGVYERTKADFPGLTYAD